MSTALPIYCSRDEDAAEWTILTRSRVRIDQFSTGRPTAGVSDVSRGGDQKRVVHALTFG